MALPPGTKIGRYEIRSLLGQGGGPKAGPRATVMAAARVLTAAVAIWSYAGDRMKAGVDTLSSKSGIR